MAPRILLARHGQTDGRCPESTPAGPMSRCSKRAAAAPNCWASACTGRPATASRTSRCAPARSPGAPETCEIAGFGDRADDLGRADGVRLRRLRGHDPRRHPGRPPRLVHLARRRPGGRDPGARSPPARTRWWPGRARPTATSWSSRTATSCAPSARAGWARTCTSPPASGSTRRPCRSSAGPTANRPSSCGTTRGTWRPEPGTGRQRPDSGPRGQSAARLVGSRSRRLRSPARPRVALQEGPTSGSPPVRQQHPRRRREHRLDAGRLHLAQEVEHPLARRAASSGRPARARSSASSARVERDVPGEVRVLEPAVARRACPAARPQSPSADQHCASSPSSSASP